MKSLYEVRLASTRQQLDDALWVRWKVFAQEQRYLKSSEPVVKREVNCFDTLETTLHLVAYAGARPVATVRLLLPNAEIARDNGTAFGTEIEQKVEIAPPGDWPFVPAETSRFCILREFRCSPVFMLLGAHLYRESSRRGVTHWVAGANTETDSIEDARLAYHVAQRLELTSERFRIRPRAPAPPPAAPSRFIYAREEKLRAERGDLAGLRLPRTLAIFAERMGARYAGEPIFDSYFGMFAMPLISSLDDVSAIVRRAA
jgi:hypothetical protein